MAGSARTIPPPPVNPETKPFWDAAAQGRLLIKRCTTCNEPHWYPRAICPFCGSERTEWMEASGHGTIYSYSVFRRLPSADFGGIADAVAKSLEGSLARLDLDRVDIFHLHNAITETGGGEALSVRQVLL
jgi:uncharacterized protein